MTSDATQPTSALNERQRMMRICAQASIDELSGAVRHVGAERDVRDMRPPETGLVMLRGRTGGDGAPFNVGEATVTRAVVQLDSGEIGYAYLLGRSVEKARLAATVDALAQTDANAQAQLADVLIAPVTERIRAEHAVKQADTAATRVDFFTLVRGED